MNTMNEISAPRTWLDREITRISQELNKKEIQLTHVVSRLRPAAIRIVEKQIMKEIERNSCTPSIIPSIQYYKHMDITIVLLAIVLTITPLAFLQWPIPGIKLITALVWALLLIELGRVLGYRISELARTKTCKEPTTFLLLRTNAVTNPQLACNLAIHREHYVDVPITIKQLCKLRQDLEDPQTSAKAIAKLLGRKDITQLQEEIERLQTALDTLKTIREAVNELEKPVTSTTKLAVLYQKAANKLLQLSEEALAKTTLPSYINPQSLGNAEKAATLLGNTARALRSNDYAKLAEIIKEAVQSTNENNIYTQKIIEAYKAITQKDKPKEAFSAIVPIELLKDLMNRAKSVEERIKRLHAEMNKLRQGIIAAREKAYSNALQILAQAVQYLRAQPRIKQLIIASRVSGIKPTELIKKKFFLRYRSDPPLTQFLHLAASLTLGLSLLLAMVLGIAYIVSPRAATMVSIAIVLAGIACTVIGYMRYKRFLLSGACIALTLLTFSMGLPIYLTATRAPVSKKAIVIEWLSAAIGVFLMTSYVLITIIKPISRPVPGIEAIIAEEQLPMLCETVRQGYARVNRSMVLLETICTDIEKIKDGNEEVIAIYTDLATYTKYRKQVTITSEIMELEKQLVITHKAINHLEKINKAYHLLAQRNYIEASPILQSLAKDLGSRDLYRDLGISDEEAEASISLLKTLSEVAIQLAFNKYEEAQHLLEKLGDTWIGKTPQMYSELLSIINREIGHKQPSRLP